MTDKPGWLDKMTGWRLWVLVGLCLYVTSAVAQTASKPPEPLKCGEYQHVYHWPGPCGPQVCDEKSMTCESVCVSPPPDACVDDIHEVTEREWQMLMKRLDELEAKTDGKAHFTTDAVKP
jgi:hypothetical protein